MEYSLSVLLVAVSATDMMRIFEIKVDDETEIVIKCSAGRTPSKSVFYPKSGKIRTTIPADYCNSCEQRKNCPVKRAKRGYCFAHIAKERRLEKRHIKETTDEFRKVYSKYRGIEFNNNAFER